MRGLAIRAVADAGALALVLLAGTSLAALVPSLRGRGLLERLAWGWLLGAAWLGGTAWALSLLLGLALGPALFAGLAAVPLAIAAVRGRTAVRLPGMPVPRDPLALALLALGLLATAALLAEAFATPVRDFDGRMTWGAQARWIAGERRVLPSALVEPAWSVEHPRYPLLLPILQALPMQLAGDLQDSRVPRVIYPPFLAAVALVLFGTARRLAGRRAALAATALFLLTPFVVFESHGGAKGTYSDLPLAAFLASGLFILLRARGGGGEGLAAGLLLGAAVLSKNEGLPLAIAAFLGGALVLLRRGAVRTGRARRLAAAALPLAGAVALVLAWKARVPNRNDEDYVRLLAHPPRLSEIATALGRAFPVAARHLFAPAEWGALWLVLPALLVLSGAWRRRRVSGAIVLVIAAEVALVLAGWVISGASVYLADVTSSRAAEQILPIVLLLSALALREPLGSRRFTPPR